jgi:hypothetical protein
VVLEDLVSDLVRLPELVGGAPEMNPVNCYVDYVINITP